MINLTKTLKNSLFISAVSLTFTAPTLADVSQSKSDQNDIIPKKGFYVNGDLGYQDRELAGENGDTVTEFKKGSMGSVGIGYRFNKNFRMSAEYARINNDVDTVASSASSGAPLEGEGNVILKQYTINAYYDVDGFGNRKQYRPYVGIGVGNQTSIIEDLTNVGAKPFGLIVNDEATAPITQYKAGLNISANDKTEYYVGGSYIHGSELLFRNTAFGNLLPQSSRNWVLQSGIRYTF